MKDRVFCQCSLLPAVTALEDFDFISLVATMPLAVAFGALKTCRPPCRLNGSLTLVLFAILGKESIDVSYHIGTETDSFSRQTLRKKDAGYAPPATENVLSPQKLKIGANQVSQWQRISSSLSHHLFHCGYSVQHILFT